MSGNEPGLPDSMDIATAARQIWDLHRRTNGATFNLYSGSLAGQSLYAVSVYSDRTRDVDAMDLSPDIIEAFIRSNLDLLARTENSVGIWLAVNQPKERH